MLILISVLFFTGLGFAVYGLLPAQSRSPIKRKPQKAAPALKLPVEGQIQPLNLELEKLRSDYANLEAEISAGRKKESEFHAELLKKDEWIKNSEEAFKKAREKSGGFEERFVNKEKELQVEFAKNVDLSREVRELRIAQDKLENEKKGLSEENERMKHQLQKLAEEQKLNQQTIAEFKKQQETSQWVAKQDFIKLNEEYSQLKKELESEENKNKGLTAIILAFLFFSYSILNAQEPAGEADSFIRHIPQQGVSAMPGSIAITASESEADYELKAFGRLPVKLCLSTEYTAIKNTTPVDLPSHLTGLSAGIETTLPFFRFDKTYLRLKLSPSYYGDDWSFKSSAFRIPAQTFLIYQPDSQWTFVAGVAGFPDYENALLPILGFIYKPNERLSFNLVPEQPNITYKLNDKLSLFAEAGFSAVEYEVDKDELSNVVLKYKESRIGTGIRYKFNKFIKSSVGVGGVFNRCLKYRDSLGKVVIKDGFYSEFRVNIYM